MHLTAALARWLSPVFYHGKGACYERALVETFPQAERSPCRVLLLLQGTALSQPRMLGHQSLETVVCQLQWSVPRHRPRRNSGSFQEIPRAAACRSHSRPYASIMLFNRFLTYVSLRGCSVTTFEEHGYHSAKTETKQEGWFSNYIQPLSFFCGSPPMQLFCGHKSFQNCKFTVHYAPCLWRNTSTSSSRFKEMFTLRLLSRLFSRENTGAIAFDPSIFTAFWLVWPFFGYETLLRRPELCSIQDHSTDSIICLSNSLRASHISLQHKKKHTKKVMFSSVRRQFAKPVLAGRLHLEYLRFPGLWRTCFWSEHLAENHKNGYYFFFTD